MTDLDAVIAGLTEAQRRMIIASEPGGWGRMDTACGVALRGAQFRTAKKLEHLGLGDYTFGSCFEVLYFNNQRGLALRERLMEKNNAG